MLPDHYAVLEVQPSASDLVIRQAYRRIIRQVHPDLAQGDPEATDRARDVNVAWAVLRDPVARAEYDRQRAERDRQRAAARAPAPAPEGTPSWGPGGVRPVTMEQLREAARREAAYSEINQAQRAAFSAASRRLGLTILLVGTILLAVFMR